MIWIFTGGRPSNSAQTLCNLPGFARMRKGEGVKESDVIVNWGVSSEYKLPPKLLGCTVLNPFESVAYAVNKFRTFGILADKGVQTVPWTANKAVAKEWQDHKDTVIARKVLTGSEGDGIVIIEEGDELIDAPLYSKYIYKVREYRVHATRTKVVATHMKIRDPARQPTNWKVRSWQNGFIFQRNNIPQNDERDKLAVAAIKALGLHFGAVDLIEDKKGKFYVLEVNTSPGIEGQTVPAYAEMLEELAIAAVV